MKNYNELLIKLEEYRNDYLELEYIFIAPEMKHRNDFINGEILNKRDIDYNIYYTNLTLDIYCIEKMGFGIGVQLMSSYINELNKKKDE